MGNYNIVITNPKGEQSLKLAENNTMEYCKKWYEEFGPAPIGWNYQIKNMNKKPREYPDHILIQGFGKDGSFITSTKARHKTNNGWYSVRMAKRDLRKQGASYFTQEKVWNGKDKGTDVVS